MTQTHGVGNTVGTSHPPTAYCKQHMQHSSIAQDGKLWNEAWSDNVGHKNQYHGGLYNFLHNIGVLTTKSWWLEVKRRSKFQYATAWPHHPISPKLATGISHLPLRQHAFSFLQQVLCWDGTVFLALRIADGTIKMRKNYTVGLNHGRFHILNFT